MKCFVVAAFLTLLPLIGFAQFTDSFSDGDFTSNPQWDGETSIFVVNPAFELQLDNAPVTDVAHLYTEAPTADSTVWEFYVRLDFAPSNNNLAKIYLKADQPNLEGPLSGYFIRLGENGSNDAIELWEQTGTNETEIISGTPGLAASNPELRIRVVRDSSGNWSVFADPAGGTNFQLEGTGFSNTHNISKYIGVVAQHTSSNADHFFFDDFLVTPIYQDTFAPDVMQVTATSGNALEVLFNEPVDQISAETPSNYSVNLGIGNPNTALLDAMNPSLVHLTFSGSFQNGQQYSIAVQNVEDENGNAISTTIANFNFFQVQPRDVIINEMMADPTPPVGLPEEEFIELHNTTPFPIDLSGWTITDGTSTGTFGSVVIPPDSFIIVVPASSAGLFAGYGVVEGLSSFPSLNNSGDQITLMDDQGQTIDEVAYSTSWYRDTDKDDGGWSLERIDPASACEGASNWIASIDPAGGTPGSQNSVLGLFPDTTAPDIASIQIIDSVTIIVIFADDPLDNDLLQPGNYTISPGISVTGASLSPTGEVTLNLTPMLQQGVLYTLQIDILRDCTGNINNTASAEFLIPEPVEMSDLIINEILFNPESGGVDFIEFYNVSDKIVDLSFLRVLRIDPEDTSEVDAATLSPDQLLVHPGEYVVVTEDPEDIMDRYEVENPEWLVEVNDLPNFPDDEGIVALQDKTGNVIDKLQYFEDWHFDLLDDLNGVSLERISFYAPTQDEHNWFSASADAGFATPTYQNSQFSPGTAQNDFFTVEPEVFSPDGDGYHDLLLLKYSFDEPGYVATITIFDAKGRPVRHLIQNNPLGTEGQLRWDGTDDNGGPARMGIYIIYIELFNLEGELHSQKLRAVLARRL